MMPIRELTKDEQDQLLSMEDVTALPVGTKVMVKWSGGNGPWEYTLDIPCTLRSKRAWLWAEAERAENRGKKK